MRHNGQRYGRRPPESDEEDDDDDDVQVENENEKLQATGVKRKRSAAAKHSAEDGRRSKEDSRKRINTGS